MTAQRSSTALEPGTRATIVYNPRSGTRDVKANLPEAIHILRNQRWQVELQLTTQAGDIYRLARDARDRGQQVVLVAGGDGSLNEAANALAHSQVALGVLPTGTANVWARQVGIPIPAPLYTAQLADAARALCEGVIRPIDLGRTGKRYFVLWSGAGLDAHVTATIEPRPSWVKRLGVVGYAARAFWIALQYRGVPMKVKVDDRQESCRAVMVLISNIQLYGGIMRPTPNARVDDGLLDVCIFKGKGFRYTARHFASIAAGLTEQNSQLMHLRGRRIRVSARQPCAVHVDAEPIGHTPIEVEVVPHALHMIVPRDAPATLFAA